MALDTILTEREAAKVLRISIVSLQMLRTSGAGPRHLDYGIRGARYRSCDLEAWVESKVTGAPVAAQAVQAPEPEPEVAADERGAA